MFKKLLALYVAFIMVLCVSAVRAEVEFDTDGIDAALLIHVDSGRVLYEYCGNEKLAVAGLSRLPALLAICDAFDTGALADDTLISVSDKASKIGGTTAFLASGEQMRATDMLKAAVMINAGDAIHSLACAAYGSESTAIERISVRMRELGISAEISGICDANLKLSASDLAIIGTALLKSETYNKFGTLFYDTLKHGTGASDTELANPNKLVKQYSGCLGIATGSSNDAGYCAVFAATRGSTSYIAVVLGADNSSRRFGMGIELLDYGFASYRSVQVAEKGDVFGEVPVTGGIDRSVKAVAEHDVSLLVSMADTQYFTETELYDNIAAPLYAGQEIGEVRFTNKAGDIMAEVRLVADEAVGKASLFDQIYLILRMWVTNI